MNNERADVCIVGAGAAGLAAAIFAGETARQSSSRTIILLDGATSIGAKILISGGGRCNVTHESVTPTDFFGNRRIIKNVLAAFSVADTVRWMASLGVELKCEETGKFFPVTDNARTVLNALVDRCRALGVTVRANHRVQHIERVTGEQTLFSVHHAHGILFAQKVILATGGRSIPKSGSDGAGYELASQLGHRITTTVPALVPLVLDDTMFHRPLSGLTQNVELTTMIRGNRVDHRTGSLLWTHFGISGPVVMDASRFWCLARAREEPVTMYGNFLPGLTRDQARAWFLEESRDHPRRSLIKMLAQHLPHRFAESIVHYVGHDGSSNIAQFRRHDRDQLLESLTKLEFPIVRDRGWNYAEVTSGGVPLEEIDFRTMESKLVPGVHLIGEILDCDGRIGGFNFQWAWATGRLAGIASSA